MIPPPISAAHPLILASGSRYRAELLQRLRIPFESVPADIDESAKADETPHTLAARLAREKAQAVAHGHPRRWVLGSDQVCACEGRVLGKPGTRENAVAQLRWLSGRRAEFLTAVCLAHDGTVHGEALDRTGVELRRLGDEEIERYVAAEPALDCAGSFKCEGLGISLFESIESRDPTGLIGLPLIAVRALLARAGCA